MSPQKPPQRNPRFPRPSLETHEGQSLRPDRLAIHYLDMEILERNRALVSQLVAEETVRNAERYIKLRRWMSSNVPEGWDKVEQLGAVGAWLSWADFDQMLDNLPECNVGQCGAATLAADEKAQSC